MQEIVDAQEGRSDRKFVELAGEVPGPLAWFHLRAVLHLVINARLGLDPVVWP
ncbi:hypothetical protein ACGFJT_37165 [Actinomadura geliboluensis]|uniref:hypothetical protein n=1 Tax=Actinomadura geliboluensis TaxID=882440 RepID=UPI0037249E6F